MNEEIGFTIVKTPISFHSPDFRRLAENEGFAYTSYPIAPDARYPDNANGSLLTDKGLHYLIDYVGTIKEIVGDKVGIAFDCGPGLTAIDALKFAKGVEPFNVMWLEDMVTGDYTPYSLAQVYRDITQNTPPTSTPASRSTCARTSASSSRPTQSTSWARTRRTWAASRS